MDKIKLQLESYFYVYHNIQRFSQCKCSLKIIGGIRVDLENWDYTDIKNVLYTHIQGMQCEKLMFTQPFKF